MEQIPNSNRNLIAPCGMNCGICIAFLRDNKPCSGCRNKSKGKPKHCVTCQIVNCEQLAATKSGFCFDCEKFPCLRMKQLDARYKKNYRTSLIDNQKQIQGHGIDAFLRSEAAKWTCSFCGKTLCVHRKFCIHCNATIERDKK